MHGWSFKFSATSEWEKVMSKNKSCVHPTTIEHTNVIFLLFRQLWCLQQQENTTSVREERELVLRPVLEDVYVGSDTVPALRPVLVSVYPQVYKLLRTNSLSNKTFSSYFLKKKTVVKVISWVIRFINHSSNHIFQTNIIIFWIFEDCFPKLKKKWQQNERSVNKRGWDTQKSDFCLIWLAFCMSSRQIVFCKLLYLWEWCSPLGGQQLSLNGECVGISSQIRCRNSGNQRWTWLAGRQSDRQFPSGSGNRFCGFGRWHGRPFVRRCCQRACDVRGV